MRKGGRVTSVVTVDCEVKFKGWLPKFDLEVVIFFPDSAFLSICSIQEVNAEELV